MLALARRLRADAARFASRLVLAFIATAVAWFAVAPVYAGVLAGVAGALAPVLDPGAEYVSDGAKVSALRPLPVEPGQAGGERRRVRQGLWSTGVTWNTPLFVAAILALPGVPWSTRGRAILIGSGVLAIGHLAGVLVNAALTRNRLPGVDPGVGAELLQGLAGFLDFVVAPVLPVALFLALAGRAPGSARSGRARPARNAPCPCGSGIKYKRCCGRSEA